MADGVSFVHLSTTETEDGRNPLTEVEAFARFQEAIGERCDEPPVVTELRRDRLVSLPSATRPAPVSRRTRSSTSSCTPATARARARSTRELLRWRTERIDAGLRSLPRAGPGRRAFGGGIVQCPTRAPGVAALRRGRPRRRGHRSRRPARRLGAARAARGPDGLAQRGGDARGRRDRLLAAQGARSAAGVRRDRARAARRRPRRRRGRLRPARRAPPRAARRALLPHARLGPRRRGRDAGRAAARVARRSRASRAAARCARGCTRSRPTSA